MKVNILMDPADARNGYANVLLTRDGWRPSIPAGLTPSDPLDLSAICAPGEAEEVVALNAIDFLAPNDVDPALAHWCSLVAVGGTFALAAVDFLEVCHGVASGKLGTQEANLLLHGPQRWPWEQKRACYHLDQLVLAVSDQGLRILKRRQDGVRSCIIATRD